jgi:hypothetical protein
MIARPVVCASLWPADPDPTGSGSDPPNVRDVPSAELAQDASRAGSAGVRGVRRHVYAALTTPDPSLLASVPTEGEGSAGRQATPMTRLRRDLRLPLVHPAARALRPVPKGVCSAPVARQFVR